MGRRDAEEASAARDFVMARVLAATASVTHAVNCLTEVAAHFTDPADDATGSERKKLLEEIDAACGAAAAATQLAMAEISSVDPEEGEPIQDDDDDDEDDEDEEEDEPAPKRRRSR